MSYPKVMTYRLAISATRCASSLITSLDKSPLYKNTGSPSSATVTAVNFAVSMNGEKKRVMY
ncbi:hypothetical protein HPJ32_04065 [Acinetobacter baumannii]|uniref:hypothetical protein n=1 Tax=Acinetobacter baumannii TaxID=470 RepID=UPI0016616AB2|nr:hypothetical protein [Acinetobacter baumannii]MBD0530748.1 hypothetical protein [Acinetobacter baumannii]MCZ3261617.1 hypothetical protein [Acinetobacter baumannii]